MKTWKQQCIRGDIRDQRSWSFPCAPSILCRFLTLVWSVRYPRLHETCVLCMSFLPAVRLRFVRPEGLLRDDRRPHEGELCVRGIIYTAVGCVLILVMFFFFSIHISPQDYLSRLLSLCLCLVFLSLSVSTAVFAVFVWVWLLFSPWGVVSCMHFIF